ncbi:transporter family-2 protein [Propionibacterium cyclohexanicum]|uniref:Transporter family-2 protein n=1 Tax=Propionibacterium cyclohexanicum TaxID=64702 RepID=A0A1H9SBY8_9ACTN|nr:DMT family transporter [Propionibacterium cyclohexanicum]SER82522.1 transporter family-2 protein [Propionibacterium cyclohexanicum]
MLALLIGIAAGVALPVQTSVNSRLRFRLGGAALLASLVSFAVGTAFLALLSGATGAGLGITAGQLSGTPWWAWSGGILGVIYLTGNLLLFPRLGAVETVILPVLGQVAMGLVIDTAGWFGSPHHPLGAVRLLGAALTLMGAVWAVGAGAHPRGDGRAPGSQLVWRMAGILTGGLSAMQTAINGRLGVVLHSALHAALISFAVGTAALLLVVVVGRQWPRATTGRLGSGPWWMWLGGLLGALVVAGNAWLVPHLGTGLTVMVVLLGQMGGSILIDSLGLLGTPRRPLSPARIAGLVTMVVGVVIIKLL